MNTWLRNHFQSDTTPPADVLQKTYDAACDVLHHSNAYPLADTKLLNRLIEEMEADAEICNLLD